MPRQSRRKCESGRYHVMLHGINRQDVFEDEDFAKILESLVHYKEICSYLVALKTKGVSAPQLCRLAGLNYGTEQKEYFGLME